MTQYRSKTTSGTAFAAERFDGATVPGLIDGYEGATTLTATLFAGTPWQDGQALVVDADIPEPDGGEMAARLILDPGDWLMVMPDGRVYSERDDRFTALYEPVAETEG